MYLSILKNYIMGYVKIEIEGYFLERLINLCISKGILLWNTNRQKSTLCTTNIGIQDFKRIVEVGKQTKCRIKIKEKKGWPFLFHKYKKRKLFFLLLCMMIVGIMFSSNFVWNIEISGNQTIDKQEMLAMLEMEGLKIGTLKNSINTKEMIQTIRLKRSDLAWIGIELKGTNAIVKLVEAEKKPEIISEEEYCNIVATKPGVIVKANAVNGIPLVKEGDVVKEGSLLIAGWLEGKYTGIRYVHANGQVQAKVWYSETKKVELNQVIAKQTGNEEKKYSVKINNFEINFYKTLSKFQKYDTIEKIEKLKLFSDFYLPIEVIYNTNYELIEETIQYSKEEAKQKAVEEAKKVLEEQIEQKENIINTYINYQETEQYVEAQVIYEVLEEIGTKEKIVF